MDAYSGKMFDLMNEQGVVERHFQPEFEFNTSDLVVKFARSKGVSWKEMDEYTKNIYDFAMIVRDIESQNNPKAVHDISTASGVYQFLVDSIPVARRRALNIGVQQDVLDDIPEDPTIWTNDQADLLFMANILGQRGSDWYIHQIGVGNSEAGIETYYKFHHTNPGRKTRERAVKYFKK